MRWAIERMVVPGSRVFEPLVDVGLELHVHRGRRLVEQQPVRSGDDGAGDSEALLLAAGEPLRPGVLDVDLAEETVELRRRRQGVLDYVGRIGIALRRIGSTAAPQRADREIGLLRQHHQRGASAMGLDDGAVGIGPDPGNGAEQGRLAAA